MNDLRSLMGYSEGSPWENAPFNLIKTPQGKITMANTKKRLKAYDAKTGKFLSDLEPGKEYQFPTNEIIEMKTLKKGGLSRDTDFGSEKKPYPSVRPSDFAGGNRSYPIPTIADAIDALRLAGLHGRDDVKAKVYAKYPSLKYQAGGQTPVELRMQDKPNPFEFKKINTKCPPGYTWSVPDNQCKPTVTPVNKIIPSAASFNTTPNPSLEWTNPNINGTKPQPPSNPYLKDAKLNPQWVPQTGEGNMNKGLAPVAPVDKTIAFHPEDEFNQERQRLEAEAKQIAQTPVQPKGQEGEKPKGYDFGKFANTSAKISLGLNGLSYGLSAFANSVEEGRQKAWNKKMMADNFNQTYSQGQNDYGVDPYEQTGQYRQFKDGGIHINPANKGKFNATKARTGKTTEELTHSDNPITRKRAIFAQNAAKWNHKKGGSHINSIEELLSEASLLKKKKNPFSKNVNRWKLQEGGEFDFLFEEDDKTPTKETVKKQPVRVTEDDVDELAQYGLSPLDIASGTRTRRLRNQEDLNFDQTSNVTPNDTMKQVGNYYLSQGYDKNYVAGVLGNIHAESTGKSNVSERPNAGGYGLFQHTGARRKQLFAWADKNGLNPSDPLTQAKFAEQEPDFQRAANAAKGKSAGEAAKIFEDKFERPGVKRSDVRIKAANSFVNQFRAGGEYTVDFKTMKELQDKGIKFKLL